MILAGGFQDGLQVNGHGSAVTFAGVDGTLPGGA